jgi:hypothetical protein
LFRTSPLVAVEPASQVLEKCLMNFRQRLLRFCTLGCGLLLILSFSLAPRLALAAIDLKIKTSPDASKSRDVISASVKDRVAELAGADSAKRSSARDTLTGEVNAPNINPEFLDIYAQELNTQLKPLVDPGQQDVKIRLNAAIVVAKVAEKAGNARLAEITEILLNDKSDAVVNWGLKAARYVLPQVLASGGPQSKGLIKAIRARAGDPVLLPLVYEALSIDFQNNRNAPQFAKMVAGAAPEVTGGLRERVDLMTKQAPPDPTVDAAGMNFLAATHVWANESPQQQLDTVQVLSDYIYVAGERAAASSGAERDALNSAVVFAGKALNAIFIIRKEAVPAAISQLTKLDPNSASYKQQIDAAYPALKALPAWKALKDPPKIQGATSAPSTAPATAK